jgi:hypothetical protein
MVRFAHTGDDDPAVVSWAEMIAAEMGLSPAQMGEHRQRIFAVARAWTEMCRSLPRHKAVDELRKGLGTTFDPACVGALIWGLAKLSGPPRATGAAQPPGFAAARARPGA